MSTVKGSTQRIAIRADASAVIGTGHLKRCLSLAQALIEAGAEVRFVCRRIDAVVAQVLDTQVFTAHWLPVPVEIFAPEPYCPPHAAWAGVPQTQDAADTAQALADWRPSTVVVDHYAFDARWHQAVRGALRCRLLVIDDTADRALDADLLLDHNWAPDHQTKYAGCLQREPLWLCGPRFALLARAYQGAARYRFHGVLRSVGIFMGGTDPGGVSARVLAACRCGGFTGPVEMVSTSANPQLADLREACQRDGNTTLTLDQSDLAAFFARHDLQIGAGGGATWERCCIGAPAVVLALVANQSTVVQGLAALGAVRAAVETTLPGVLQDLIANLAARQSLAERAAALVDGRGAQRVAVAISQDQLQLRPAEAYDAPLLHGWRNHPSVRAVSATEAPIAFEAHDAWMRAVLAHPARWLFVGEVGQLPVGSIRFDRLANGHLEVSLYLDPDLQGLGLGRRLLAAGERALLALHPAGITVDASVQPGNTASQQLFSASGYHGGPLKYEKTIGPLSGPTEAAP